jgi:DNA-binding HxlR family transcriptional regulator
MATTFGCGLEATLSVVGGKWKPLILFHLQGDSLRFSELRRRVSGISEKVLIQQLRELELHGVVLRNDHHQVPPRVDYALTHLGCSLLEALTPLCAWGERNREHVEAVAASTGASKGPVVDESGVLAA